MDRATNKGLGTRIASFGKYLGGDVCFSSDSETGG